MIPATADQCVSRTCRDMLAGNYIATDKDKSFEVLHYQTGMGNPRARILTNPARPLNLVVAVARFAWLIAANNRVEDIAFYEPKVRGFSDDGLTVPGSDYGMRLFQPRPGLNQIQGVVDRLRANPGSRQAAAVVWQPEDAVRESRDIPCTFGMFFHIRDGQPWGRKGDFTATEPLLHMCVNMRSNNAFRILPFNLFEFSLLQELVAAELDVRLGDYVHWAASMHVYDNENEALPTEALARTESDSISMPAMPRDLGKLRPLKQAELFARLEAQMRHACSRVELDMVMAEALDLDNYWLELLGVLYCWNAAKRGYPVPYATVHADIREQVQVACQKAYK